MRAATNYFRRKFQLPRGFHMQTCQLLVLLFTRYDSYLQKLHTTDRYAPRHTFGCQIRGARKKYPRIQRASRRRRCMCSRGITKRAKRRASIRRVRHPITSVQASACRKHAEVRNVPDKSAVIPHFYISPGTEIKRGGEKKTGVGGAG